jgi:hypothetical protein
MSKIYLTLARYEILIYLLLATGGLFTLRGAWRAWNEWRLAVFSLERELALRHLSRQVALLILILLFFCGEFALATFVVPALPSGAMLPTPTLNLLASPVASPLPSAQGCTTSIRFTQPQNGAELSGNVEIRGTIDVPDFAFYQYEYAPLGSDIWTTIYTGRQSGKDISLGNWNTALIPAGEYQLRLVVVDVAGKIQPPCVINVRVKEAP